MMPVPVEAHGFGWTAGGVWTGVVILIGIIIRQVGPWRKQSIDAQERLRDDLLRRVEKLERELDRKDARHRAERSLDRHRLANIGQCFDAMILMLEVAQDPAQVQTIVARVKQMRARQLEEEALEKAAIHAAAMADANERSSDRELEASRNKESDR